METITDILEKMGASMEQNPSVGKRLELFYITNRDGSVRWFWASHVAKPLFLHFYNISSWRARCFVWAIKIIFALQWQRLFFKSTSVRVQNMNNTSFPLDTDWAIFTGTVGINRKAIAFSELHNAFYKIALSPQSAAMLLNEQRALSFWEKKGMKHFEIPKVLGKIGGTVKLEAVGKKGTRASRLTEAHLNALQEIQEKTHSCLVVGQLSAYQNAQNHLKSLLASQDERLPKGILRKLSILMSFIRPDTLVETCSIHGDFTAWNMYVRNGKLCIYDWEAMKLSMPLGFDAFHFIVQQGILVDKKCWKDIYKEIEKKLAKRYDLKRYFRYYILFNTLQCLKQYEQQEKWHEQVYWLLNTWNDALSMLLKQEIKHKAMVALDVFDFLYREKYALLKGKYENPEEIDEYTDIDLCMEKSSADKLLTYLKKHSLVKKAKYLRKSFMSNVLLFLEDGDILSIDCIWKFKRKATYMLATEEVLEHTFVNEYNIKKALDTQEARYIGLFYSLNHAPVPTHYKPHLQCLEKSENTLDKNLFLYASDNKNARRKIIEIIKQNPHNQGFKRIKNFLFYCIDTAKELFFQKGITITFSGVDGAGKSTVIENMVHILEKKLRKKVIVLRHRPSILPILSAWTKGKKKAEEDAVNTLPRQGKNQSRLSSLIRFAYYYTDYFVGQFYIYARYTMRGYIVIYDRYYFDFINDSKRSNINLPASFVKFWYRFLIKPDINFFLYAKSDVILERKKELDKDTIENLNTQYLTLFNSLQEREQKKMYFPIENINLEKTLHNITEKILTL